MLEDITLRLKINNKYLYKCNIQSHQCQNLVSKTKKDEINYNYIYKLKRRERSYFINI